MLESEQQEVFNEWLDKYRALLFKVVRAYTQNIEERNDLFQEVSMQVWRSIPNFRGDAAVSTWLYRISLNTAIKWVTKERKHADNHTSLEDSGYVLAQKQDADERLAWLYEQIAKLDDIDKSLTLLLLDGYSYKEMATIIGLSESNVAVKIHRIKKHLILVSQKTKQPHGI